MKIIIDNFPQTKVIATGSSSFELADKINEPLTGRKWEYKLFPFSFNEMKNFHGLFTEKSLLNHRLIYGYYPDVINNPGKEVVILNELANSYLYKDILTWERIMKPDALEKLVRALAFQIGNEVSYHELGQLSGLDNETVQRYILLLERAFVIFRLSCFNRNLRTELKKSRKIYFYDNGLRNAIINQFNPLELRNDTGALWENYMVSERLKFKSYQKIYANTYFWRTLAQQEIDYIEEYNGKIFAYEFKWKPKNKFKMPAAFIKEYSPSVTELIHSENFDKFISI